MNRLPCCDLTTQRSELAVFASLGFVGVMMVALAAAQMTKFVAGSDRMTAALAGRTMSPVVTPLADERRAATTNVGGSAAVRAAARVHTNGKVRSASDSGLSLVLR